MATLVDGTRIPFRDARGKERSLQDFRGDVLLIVNTASYCGYTPQHGALASLQKRYEGQRFRVLGFPCNDFGQEEPDSLATIKRFCERTYGVTYELFDKVSIRPPRTHPLYAWLTASAPKKGPVTWNFEKFLISREGEVVGRWAPDVEPDSRPVVRAVERELDVPIPEDAP